MCTGNADCISEILTILIISFTFTLTMLNTVAFIFRMEMRTIRSFQKRHDEDCAVVMVDMNIVADDSGKIAAAYCNAA